MSVLLYLLAAVCFALAAFNIIPRVNLIAAGLFFWVLVSFLAAIDSLA